jgi:ribose transport system substrate-binding protein
MVDVTTGNGANWEARANLVGLKLPRRIGVCVNFGSHIWYHVQNENERNVAQQLGFALDVVNADMESARQASQVEQFVAEGVDALIFSAVDASQAPAILEPAHRNGIPVITESIWVESPAVAANAMINEYVGGVKVGRAAGVWLRSREREHGPIKVLDVTVPWLDEGVQRSDGFLAGLRESIPEVESVRLDGRADIATAAQVTSEALHRDSSFTLVFGVDDESAIGARKAYEQFHIPLDNVLICSFGFSGAQAYDWLANGVYQIVCAMFPEYQAHMLVHAAIYAYNHRSLPHHLVAPCIALTADALPRYYTRTPSGVTLHVDAVKEISTEGEERQR